MTDPPPAFPPAPRSAQSPIHWLLLVFAITGLSLTLMSFIVDLFSGPKPPPRSQHEATTWRGKRQITVVGVVLLGCTTLAWGIVLMYYTFLADGCSSYNPSLYNIAFLLVLILVVLLALALILGCCVGLDWLLSGCLKFVVTLRDQPDFNSQEPLEEPYQKIESVKYPYSIKYGTASAAPPRDTSYYVGAIDESGMRTVGPRLS